MSPREDLPTRDHPAVSASSALVPFDGTAPAPLRPSSHRSAGRPYFRMRSTSTRLISPAPLVTDAQACARPSTRSLPCGQDSQMPKSLAAVRSLRNRPPEALAQLRRGLALGPLGAQARARSGATGSCRDGSAGQQQRRRRDRRLRYGRPQVQNQRSLSSCPCSAGLCIVGHWGELGLRPQTEGNEVSRVSSVGPCSVARIGRDPRRQRRGRFPTPDFNRPVQGHMPRPGFKSRPGQRLRTGGLFSAV